MPKKTYVVSLKYWDPVEGTAYFTCDSPEEAREKCFELFKEHRDVEIVSIEESPISQLELDLRDQERSHFNLEQMLASFAPPEDKGELN